MLNWRAVRIIVVLTLGIILLLSLIGIGCSLVLGKSITLGHVSVYGLLAWFGWSMAEKHNAWYERISAILEGKNDLRKITMRNSL